MDYSFKQLSSSPADIALLKKLLRVFADAFDDQDSYESAVPGDDYLHALLSKPTFIMLVAVDDKDVVGGLVAYELEKFEQNRRELYIYDLAVTEQHRRKGIATNLINELRRVAKERNAYIIYVQADKEDVPAIKLYESLGTRKEAYHFDIPVDDKTKNKL
jgi:aminoglycoside 3-N-acetyltransferase I